MAIEHFMMPHLPRPTPVILGVALFGVLSCAVPTGPTTSDILRAEASLPTLSLTNVGVKTAYTVVIERETANRIRFTPCLDPSICAGIAAGGSRELPYHEITGYHAGAREAIVYHWQLTPNPAGGFLPDSIRTLVVRLR